VALGEVGNVGGGVVNAELLEARERKLPVAIGGISLADHDDGVIGVLRMKLAQPDAHIGEWEEPAGPRTERGAKHQTSEQDQDCAGHSHPRRYRFMTTAG